MTDITDHEAPPPDADDFDANDRFADDSADDGRSQDDGDEGQGAAGTRAKAPLSPEELERRYENLGRDLRTTRREAREARERADRAEAMLRERAPARQEQEEELPDPEEDPIGFLKIARKMVLDQRQGETQERERQQQQETFTRQVRQVTAFLGESEADFAGAHPDYADAAKHFRTARLEELKDQGFSEQEAGTAFAQELMTITLRAQQTGADPAERIYALSKRRGFGVDKGPEALQRIERGQRAGRSLSASGGSAAGTKGALDVRTVAEASNKDLLAQYARFSAEQKRRERKRA